MKIGEQKIIDGLEERIQMAKDLLSFLSEDGDQTEKLKKTRAFLEQERMMCETMIALITTGS